MLLTDFIDKLKEAVGKTYTGYKGGEFTMTRDTAIWVDNYSCYSSTAVMGLKTHTGMAGNLYRVIIETGYVQDNADQYTSSKTK